MYKPEIQKYKISINTFNTEIKKQTLWFQYDLNFIWRRFILHPILASHTINPDKKENSVKKNLSNLSTRHMQ